MLVFVVLVGVKRAAYFNRVTHRAAAYRERSNPGDDIKPSLRTWGGLRWTASDFIVIRMINNSMGWVFVVGSVVCAGCNDFNLAPTSADGRTPYQGIVEHEERLLAFEVPGRVSSVAVVRGAILTPQTEVAVLDDSLERANRAGRVAEIHIAEAQLRMLQHGSRPAEKRRAQAEAAAAAAAEALLQQNLDRARQLARSGAAAPATVDDLQAQLNAASAKRSALEEQARLVVTGSRSEEIEAGEARLEGAKASLAVIDQRLTRYRLRSEIEGSVIDVLIKPGEVVAPGTPVVSVADLQHPYVDVFVPQAQIASVQIGDKVRVRVDGVSNALPGHIEHLATRTEFTPRFLFSDRERPNLVIRVRVRIDDPKHQLRAGVPAFVTPDANQNTQAAR